MLNTFILLLTATKNLKSNKRRTILSILGIVVGITSVLIIMIIGDSFATYVKSNISANGGNNISVIFTSSDVSEKFIDRSKDFEQNDIDYISNIKGVIEVERKIESTKKRMLSIEKLDNVKEAYSLVVEDIKDINKDISMKEGENINIKNIQDGDFVVLISDELNNSLFNNKSSLGKSILLNKNVFLVKGIFSKSSNIVKTDIDVIVAKNSLTKINKSFLLETESLEIIIDEEYNANEKGEKIIEYLNKKNKVQKDGIYEFANFGEFSNNIESIIKSISYFIALISSISLVIATIGIMNMMYTSVAERTKEIGIRRAVGSSKESIRKMFLYEGVIVSLIGGVIAISLGIIISFIIIYFLPFEIHLTIKPFIISLSVSTLIGILASYLPSKLASEKNIVEIL